jgi:hypothetical protein
MCLLHALRLKTLFGVITKINGNYYGKFFRRTQHISHIIINTCVCFSNVIFFGTNTV